jgi:hypothetical protein
MAPFKCEKRITGDDKFQAFLRKRKDFEGLKNYAQKTKLNRTR